MQKKKTERRIDYSREEMADSSQYSISSFDEKIKKIQDKYGFEKDAFKRDGDRYNFYPPEYAPLISLLVKSISENPSMGLKPQDKTSDDVKLFNLNFRENIHQLPNALKEIVENQPWYRTSEKITSHIDLLVEEMVQVIYNLTAFHNGDIGQAMIWLCRELDKINYQLYRGHRISSGHSTSAFAQQRDIYDKIREELALKTQEERKAIYEECPDLEFIFQMNSQKEHDCDNPNLSIDKGVSEVIKSFMDIINVNAIREGEVIPQEFLSQEQLDILISENPGVTEEGLNSLERQIYYDAKSEKWGNVFRNCIKTPGHMSFEMQTGRKWESIIKRIQDGSFTENYKAEFEGQKYKFEMSAEDFEKMVYKIPKQELNNILLSYCEHYKTVQEQQKEMENVVKRFIGQVLVAYLK